MVDAHTGGGLSNCTRERIAILNNYMKRQEETTLLILNTYDITLFNIK